MISKLESLRKRLAEIDASLADPEVARNPEAVRQLAQERADIVPLVEKFEELLDLQRQLAQARELIETSDDADMVALAREEEERLEGELAGLQRQLQVMLLPPDPLDSKDVIIEIRAGAGGEEAALFAADLARMYLRYAEEKGWETEIVSANQIGIGGYKEIVFTVRGRGAYSRLKYERGVHRVQRIPETEASGRIHTSTATVAVLPEVEEVEVEISPDDIEMEVFRSSGPGGQHMQKNATAVRLTHKPTGMVVTCQSERSQAQNRARALSILRARLHALEEEKRQAAIEAERRAQVGTGERSEKIRTYNFPQNRVTDHRINFTTHRLSEVLDGDLDEIIDALAAWEQEQRLQQLAIGRAQS